MRRLLMLHLASIHLVGVGNLRSRPVRVHGWKREQASRIQAFLRDRRQYPILVEIVNVTEMNRVHRLRGTSRVQDNRLGERA